VLIDSLSYPEHQEAHKGNWKIPSNWHYDPATKEYTEFGEGKFIPCKVISLSEPIQVPTVEAQKSNIETEYPAQIATEPTTKQNPPSQRREETQRSQNDPHKQTMPSSPPERHESIGDRILHIVKVMQDFGERHPVLATIGKVAGAAGLAIAGEALASGGRKSGGGSSYESEGDSDSSSDDDHNNFTNMDNGGSLSDSRNYPEERSSPSEHTVPGHGQHYHTRDGVIWKEKESYQRGGKRSDG